MNPISRFIRRSDFRAHPLRAAWRRLFWRLRWLVSSRPWVHTLPSGQKLLSPRHGTGVMIYYHGCSEPDTFDFLERFLDSGMNVIDVGAHLGEYTVLCAGAVGQEGRVHSFEPDAELLGFLRRSLEENGYSNVIVNEMAVADHPCERKFEIRSEPSLSSLRPEREDRSPHRSALVRTIVVPATTLDDYCSRHPGRVHLVKLDVEGAELEVLRGAERLMTGGPGRAPVWVFEASEANCGRFGYRPETLIRHFLDRGYHVVRYRKGGSLARIEPTDEIRGTFNLVACTDLGVLERKVAGRR